MKEEKILEIKKHALERKIPILRDKTLEYILNIIKSNNVENMLEVGTAVGYSAICFSKYVRNIDTIEIEDIRVNEANENIKKLELESKINVILGDGLNILPKLIEQNKKYDFIFIDASKGKYYDFFNYSLELLNEKGIIICDNVLYKGMVLSDYNGHKHRTAVNKLRKFIEYIKNIDGITSEILDIDDGIAISIKK